MLKYKADLKTLLYMALTTGLFVFLWISRNWDYSMLLFTVLYIAHLFFAVSVAVMAHNQMHVPMWKSKFLNVLSELWITVFYGFPVFAWIPTHNRNHHRYVNTEPDDTKTYRYTEKNTLWSILIYPSVSAYYQQGRIGEFLKERFGKNRAEFTYYIAQIAVLVAWIATFFILDWWSALIYVFIPQQVSLMVVLFFNYIQHVHADEDSEYNHSRNMTGGLNFFLFNNGLHTAHHINANLHWSELPALHAKLEPHIDPALNERSFWWYCFRTYILGIFFKSARTHSMRLDRINKKQSEKTQPSAVA